MELLILHVSLIDFRTSMESLILHVSLVDFGTSTESLFLRVSLVDFKASMDSLILHLSLVDFRTSMESEQKSDGTISFPRSVFHLLFLVLQSYHSVENISFKMISIIK